MWEDKGRKAEKRRTGKGGTGQLVRRRRMEARGTRGKVLGPGQGD